MKVGQNCVNLGQRSFATVSEVYQGERLIIEVFISGSAYQYQALVWVSD